MYKRQENKLIITSGGVTNSYYMFGGKDESSYTLVQGITLSLIHIYRITGGVRE